jgi:predicted Rossmann-fold nucleotide-binding protein
MLLATASFCACSSSRFPPLLSSSSSSVKARRGNAAVVSTSVADADSFGAQQQHQRRRRRRESVDAISRELETIYSLVESNGRGAIYLGSSRIKEGHDVFERSKRLATSVALLLECTTWSGIGPGLMDAVTLGGLEANGKASGILILMGEKEEQTGKITRQKTRKHPYLKESQYCACSFFSARKHGLVDAGVRDGKESTKTAFFCLPGGIGTLDEFAEILTLFQLRRIGSEEKVPFVLMNYDGVFDKLLEFITESCVEHGLVNRGEMEEHLKVCSTNEEALAYLKEFYAL